MNRFACTIGALCTFALVTPVVAAHAQEEATQEQEACAPRAQIVDKLSKDFKEQQQAVGVVNKDAVLELSLIHI